MKMSYSYPGMMPDDVQDNFIEETEQDALLLENNLVKEHQPPYNIRLKDDKTFPWICIKNERFPRVFQTRRLIKDGSEYFGPYTSVKTVYTLLDLIRGLYQLRTCNYDLSQEKIDDGRDTNWVVDDLKDKESVIKFLTEEWYAEVNEIMEIDLTKYLKDFKIQRKLIDGIIIQY